MRAHLLRRATRTPLHFDIKSEKIEIIEVLLKSGADPNILNCYSETPLLISNNESIIAMLLDNGADPNSYDRFCHDTPLDIYINNSKIVKLLLEKGANPNLKNGHERTPLWSAIDNRNIESMKILLDYGSDPFLEDFYAITPLFYCFSFMDGFMLMVEKGLDLSRKDSNDNTILHKAVYCRNVEIVQFLISRGLDVNSRNVYEQTPMFGAAMYGSKKIINILKDNGADINAKDKNGRTVMHEISRDFLSKCLSDVYPADKYPEIVYDSYKYPILHYPQDKPVKQPFSYEALFTPNHDAAAIYFNINGTQKTIHIPNNIDTFKYLAQIGFDINPKDNHGITPIAIASMEDQKEKVLFLIEKGVSVNEVVGDKGYTPLMFAIEYNNVEVVNVLLDNGADPNIASKDGVTPLMLASKFGMISTVEHLLSKGADKSSEDISGKTAITFAEENNQENVISLL